MGCIDAYREALMRDFSSTAPPATASTPLSSQRQAAETDRESGTAMALADDSTAAKSGQGG
jgi:hypothetical protein